MASKTKSALPQLERMLANVFNGQQDAPGDRRTRLVSLDREGCPEYTLRKTASGQIVYGPTHPLAGQEVPPGTVVRQQECRAGQWLDIEG